MKYKGFTFIEVMIVVAIVGLLVSIAVPNFILFQCKKKGENIGIDKITTKKLCDIDVRSTEAIRSGKVNIEYYLGSNNNYAVNFPIIILNLLFLVNLNMITQ